MSQTPKKLSLLTEGEKDGHRELTVKYPPLAISSENLADDEREDTSEGEIEPEPDYDLEDCCGGYCIHVTCFMRKGNLGI